MPTHTADSVLPNPPDAPVVDVAPPPALHNGGFAPAREPDKDWDEDQLANWGKSRLQTSENQEAKIVALGRRSIKNFYEAGWALSYARDRKKADPNEGWHAFLKRHGLDPMTVGDCIAFFERAEEKGWDEVKKCATLANAKRLLGMMDENGKRLPLTGRKQTRAQTPEAAVAAPAQENEAPAPAATEKVPPDTATPVADTSRKQHAEMAKAEADEDRDTAGTGTRGGNKLLDPLEALQSAENGICNACTLYDRDRGRLFRDLQSAKDVLDRINEAIRTLGRLLDGPQAHRIATAKLSRKRESEDALTH